MIIFNKLIKFYHHYRKEKEITLRGDRIPPPIQYFSDIDLPSYVVSEIKRQNYEYPTPIQAQGWPIALSGHDMVGVAKVNFNCCK